MTMTESMRVRRLVVPVDRITSLFATAGALAIVAIAFLTIADVALRAALSITIRGLNEILVLVLGVAVAACLPSGFARAIHLSVDLLTSVLRDRVGHALKFAGAAVLLVFAGIVGVELLDIAQTYGARGQTTIILGWPIAPFYYAMAAFVLVCVPIQALHTIEGLSKALAGASPTAKLLVLALALALAGLTVALWQGGIGNLPGYGWLRSLAPAVMALTLFGVMWLGMLLGVPLAAAMGIVGFCGIAVVVGLAPAGSVVGGEVAKYLTSPTLAVLPLFLLMGAFASVAGLSADIYRFAYELLKPLRGSLAHATIAGCAGFGALTGSSLATAATFGKVALPEMQARNYDPALAAGSVAAGGTLGSLVPPSTALILFALLSEQSIGRLFMAAVGPAILAIALYLLVIWTVLKLRPQLAPAGTAIDGRTLLAAAKACWGAALLFGLVIGGIYTGIFTDTEAASVGAGGAFLFALFRGKLGGGRLWAVMAETTTTIAMIYMLIFGAVTFSFFIALTQVPALLSSWIVSLGVAPLVVVLLLVAVYLLLGMVMDSYAMMVITVPIFLPLIVQNGYDPVWWGVITVICVEMGMITPPFGMNIFMLRAIAKDVSLATIYRGVMPFVAVDLIKVALIIALPAIALWLPSGM